MALVTRCSNASCLTLFRVTPAQLQAFGGQVRCGACGIVFDAFPSLTTVAESALRTLAASAPPDEKVPEDAASGRENTPDPGVQEVSEVSAEPALTAMPDLPHVPDVPEVPDAPDAPGRPDVRRSPAISDTEPDLQSAPTLELPSSPVSDPPLDAQSVLAGEADTPAPHFQASESEPESEPDAMAVSTTTVEHPREAGPAARSDLQADPQAEWPPEPLLHQTPGPPTEEPSADPDAHRVSTPISEASPDASIDEHTAPVANSQTAGSVADPLDLVAAGSPDPVALPPEEDADRVTAKADPTPRPTPYASVRAIDTPAITAIDAPAIVASELTDYSVSRESAIPGPESPGKWRRLAPWALLAASLGAAGMAVLALSRHLLPAPVAAALDPVLGPLGRALAVVDAARLLSEHGLLLAIGLIVVLFLMLRRFRATWVVAVIVLALLLAGQILYIYRTSLAAHYPATRPVLESLCALAGCVVGLPRAADQLVIEASDLQAIDLAKPNLIQLSATVRNLAPFEIAYPAIEVTLTDPQDRPLARRILLPEQYLARKPQADSGLRAGGDFSIRLTLDTTELRPVGYRLYLFYP